jgi:hypothetical protein
MMRHGRHSGFTLLELIVANVIAVTLLGALVVALRVISHNQAHARELRASVNPTQDAIVSLIQRDLVNSRRMWRDADGGGIVLSGYASLDPQAGFAPTTRLCRVHYRLMGNGMLVRSQEPMDGPVYSRPWSELVCGGVKTFSVELKRDSDKPSGDGSDAGMPISSRAMLVVGFADASKQIQQELWLR